MCFSIHSIAQQGTSRKTILDVGAHPDDETAIVEVLVKYARLGLHNTHLLKWKKIIKKK